MVLRINSSACYISESTSREKYSRLEILQKQVGELQEAFIKSQDDNKKIRSRLIYDD